MSDWQKTIVFAAIAVASMMAATLVYVASRPAESDDYALIGKPFYPDFVDPREANYLEVAVYDFEKKEPKKFRVEKKDGVWVIPTAYDYPAEARERLAKTSACVVGLSRLALKGRRPDRHEQYGVVDPLSEEADSAEEDEIGFRIALGKDDEVLADFVIGNEAEDADIVDEQLREVRGEREQGPLYYVRLPGAPETFLAEVQPEKISTRFADWIEPDLLQVEASSLRKLVFKNYEIEMQEKEFRLGPQIIVQEVPTVKQTEELILTREQSWSDWELEGIDPETEKLEQEPIDQLVSALDDLEIVGVRPKFKLDGQTVLTADLSVNLPKSVLRDRAAAESAIRQVQLDLDDKGFYVMPGESENDPPRLFADKGEVTAAADNGVVYHLYFGNVFLGDTAGLEIKNKEQGKNGSGTNASADAQESDAETQKNRYLLVRVTFDESLVTDEPVKPTRPLEPEKPAEVEPPAGETGDAVSDDTPGADTEKQPADSTEDGGDEEEEGSAGDGVGLAAPGKFMFVATDDADATDTEVTNADGDVADVGENPADEDVEPPGAESPQVDPDAPLPRTPFVPEGDEANGEGDEEERSPAEQYAEQMEEYRDALEQYEEDLKQYEREKKEHEERLEEAKKKVTQLNARFRDWFYVISAKNLEELRLTRAELVQPKEPEEGKGDSDEENAGDGVKEGADTTDAPGAGEPGEPETDDSPAEPPGDAAQPEMTEEEIPAEDLPGSEEAAETEAGSGERT